MSEIKPGAMRCVNQPHRAIDIQCAGVVAEYFLTDTWPINSDHTRRKTTRYAYCAVHLARAQHIAAAVTDSTSGTQTIRLATKRPEYAFECSVCKRRAAKVARKCGICERQVCSGCSRPIPGNTDVACHQCIRPDFSGRTSHASWVDGYSHLAERFYELRAAKAREAASA